MNGGLGNTSSKYRNLFHAEQGFFCPGHGVFRLGINRWHKLLIGDEYITTSCPQEIFGVAANIHVIVAMYTDSSHNKEPRFFLAYILQDFFKGFPV